VRTAARVRTPIGHGGHFNSKLARRKFGVICRMFFQVRSSRNRRERDLGICIYKLVCSEISAKDSPRSVTLQSRRCMHERMHVLSGKP